MHDPDLRDNPPAPPSNKVRTRPFEFQQKIYNQSHPDIALFLERIRALTDQYEGRFTVAEVGGENAMREMKLFTEGERRLNRSEEHTSELQSLMRISYAVFCLKKKKKKQHIRSHLIRNTKKQNDEETKS